MRRDKTYSVSAIMQDFKNTYEKLKKEIFSLYKNGKIEESLNFTVVASTFAWRYHFGYWYDDDLEMLIKKIGSHLLEKTINIHENIQLDSNSILFFTTFLTNLGGHTEAMKLWIDCLSDSFENVYVVSTEVYSKTSIEFSEADINKKVKYIRLLGKKYSDKIKKLANFLVKVKPNYVVLFIDPNDVVSLSALSYLKSKLDFKVIFFNHSDHTFWLGKNLIDVLVEFRAYSAVVSRVLRKFQGSITIIPLSTKIHMLEEDEPEDVLRSLNLPQNYRTISMSIGSSWKFVSDDQWDYFRTIKNILSIEKNHIHILVTTKSTYIKNKFSQFPKTLKDRFKIVYNVSNPLPYYKISDFIIESFPMTGGTVRLEAMALAKPIIFIRNNKSALISFEEVIPPSYRYIASNEEDIVKYVDLFIKNKEERKRVGESLKNHFEKKFSPSKICIKIRNIFKDDTILPNLQYENIDLMESDEYLFSYDIKCKGLLNPYLILLRIYLDKKHFSIIDYFRIFKNLNIKERLT